MILPLVGESLMDLAKNSFNAEIRVRALIFSLAVISAIVTSQAACAWPASRNFKIKDGVYVSRAQSAHAPSLINQNCVFPDGSSLSYAAYSHAHCDSPQQILRAYGVDKVHDRGLTGEGQVIVLIEAFGSPTLQNDLDVFSDTFQIPRSKIEFYYPQGQPYVNPLQSADQSFWAGEATLDTQMAHAAAPDAKIVAVVIVPNENVMFGVPDLMSGIEAAVKTYPGSIISNSWGFSEPSFSAEEISKYLGPQGVFHKILDDARRNHITVVAPSGDTGSINPTSYIDSTGNLNSVFDSGNKSALYPASDPLVLAVGGTWLQEGWEYEPQGTADTFWGCKLQTDSNSQDCGLDFSNSIGTSPRARREYVWNEAWVPLATGGGLSQIFGPQDFQQRVLSTSAESLKNARGIPDVSFAASVDGALMIYEGFTRNGAGESAPQWSTGGGTSQSAPAIAGILALAAQQAGRSLGYINPLLYAMKAESSFPFSAFPAFHDILPANVGVGKQVPLIDNAFYFNALYLQIYGTEEETPYAVPGYSVGCGYNLATGLGTPNGESFIESLALKVFVSDGAISKNKLRSKVDLTGVEKLK